MTNDPTSMSQLLSHLTADGPQFGGLAYSVVNGTAGGGTLLIYDDGAPPSVQANGQVDLKGGVALSPSLWAGNAVGAFVQKGQLGAFPTFSEWAAGTNVKGWNLAKETASISSQSFVYNGWPYPASGLGACN
jgi:hypothetical protein